MEHIGKFVKLPKLKPKKNRFLHTPDHLLADELATKLHDSKHFGFYLKMATLYDHNFLLGLAGQILENKNAKTPGKLFAYLIKQHNKQDKLQALNPK